MKFGQYMTSVTVPKADPFGTVPISELTAGKDRLGSIHTGQVCAQIAREYSKSTTGGQIIRDVPAIWL